VSEQSIKVQRRSRSIAMTSEEIDAFLGVERVCRTATVGPQGPHATPLWFVWSGGSFWLTSLARSQRWMDLERDPRIAVVVDAGVTYTELRGVELRGSVSVVGEVPRTGERCPELEEAEQAFADKYTDGQIVRDGKHAWLRITAEKISSWDFRKNSALTAPVPH